MLKEIRKRNGYTQCSLAKELGVSQQAVSNWENGSTEPSVEMLCKLSEIFGCTIDELIRR